MSSMSRRHFVKGSAALGVLAAVGLPGTIQARGLNDKLQVGFVAVGGRAVAHTKAAYEEGCRCVAFAEVDKTRWDGALEKEGWSEAKGYTDWRKVFENHANELDVILFMSKAILCAIIVLVSTAGRLTVYAGTPYIGHWALTLPAESAGWLGVEEADGQLQASILWGGGSVRPVSSVTVEGDRLVITRVQVQRGGADRGKKTTETITASLSGDSLKLVNRTPFVPARSTCRAIIRTSTTGT